MTGTESNHKRDFLQIPDLTRDELLRVLSGAHGLKHGEPLEPAPLSGLSIATIFRKSSTRTRVSFEVGAFQLGAHAVVLGDSGSQIGRGEPIADTARVLSGFVDAITIRTFAQSEIEELAAYASVPVINALTDLLHPCQILADLQTAEESLGVSADQLSVAWIGDGNNMANSWLNAAAVLGFELRLACPEGYDPDPEILARAQASTRIHLGRSPIEAAAGANVVTTDVWASMGQEEEALLRQRAFRDFQVDDRVMAAAADEAIFLHCLPAHRGEEVAAEVIDGPQSRVFDEAENRLHAQKALLLFLLAPGTLPTHG